MLPPLSPSRAASRRQLSRTSAMTERTSSRSTPMRAAISVASSSACWATRAIAPIPARVTVSTAPRSSAGTAVRTRRAPLPAPLALRRGRSGRRRGDRRGTRSLRRGVRLDVLDLGLALALRSDGIGILGERTADRGDTGESPEVVTTPGEFGLALLERCDERCGEEDRGVRARSDADEEGEREVLERV